MHTGQALGTMVANEGVLFLNDDILLWTDLGANAASDALVRVHMLAHGGDSDGLHGAGIHDGAHRRAFGML